jgi:hemerythrin
MALFEWKPSYSVKNLTIDTQHKRLIELINRLHEAMRTGSGKSEVGKVLTELVSYTNTHFAEEEKRMLACGYQGFAAHKQVHDAFVKQTREFLRQYQSGSITLSHDVLKTLKDWLINHIEKMDQAYVPAMLDKAAA